VCIPYTSCPFKNDKMTLFSVADHHHHVLNCSLLYFSTIVDFVPCKHDANCPTRLAVLSTHAVLVLDIPSSETPAGWGGDRTCKKASSRLGRKLAKIYSKVIDMHVLFSSSFTLIITIDKFKFIML